MIDGETGMALIREALEGTIETRVASAVIFDALAKNRDQELPQDAESLLEFARGPLREAVQARVGSEVAADVVSHVERIFARVGQRPVRRDGSSTLEVPVTDGPIRVLVVSSKPSLAVALRASLGGERVAVGTANEVPRAAALAGRIKPDVWIVDASDPIEDSVDSLVALLSGAKPADCRRLLWASEQPWGSDVMRALEASEVAYTSVDRREGVDPLLDLIRSLRERK